METTNDQSISSEKETTGRESAYISVPPDSLFTWYHSTALSRQLDCVAIICSPLGHEYIHCHRSIRHLADQLAQHGVPTVRFDYSGIGDSSGTDLEPDRWETWLANIRAVMDFAKKRSGRKRICLIGIHLGATLASIVTRQAQVDYLVLWNVPVSGRRYLREIQAIASAAGQSAMCDDGSLECAGFVISSQTIEALRTVNLLDQEFKVDGRILVIAREDLAPDSSLHDHFRDHGKAFDCIVAAGYAEMMAEPQFTVVPAAAIAKITNWLVPQCAVHDLQPAGAVEPVLRASIAVTDSSGISVTVEEICCLFGENPHLFGILCRPHTRIGNLPLIVLFNAGSVHHVGPNRLYVTLARNLASLGFASFRFDLQGIGDSVCPSISENHPYPATAGANAVSSLEYLQAAFGYERFILLGLCSGAHTAFHAGLNIRDREVPEVILINPLTFHWVDGMSLETTRRFKYMSHYKGSLRNPASWLKLFRGNANVAAILGVIRSYLGTKLSSLQISLKEMLTSKASTRLSGDLRKLFELRRTATLYISDSDPGLDILMAEAKRTATKAVKSGQMTINIIKAADHTFSWAGSRLELVGKVSNSLARKYSQCRRT